MAAEPCADAGCALAAMAQSPVRHIAFWQPALAQPLSTRIAPAPPPLVDYIRLDNVHGGLPERPVASAADAAFLLDLQAVLATLPASIRALLQNRLAGIYLADHIGSTGYTEEIDDAAGRPVAGFIVLDPSTLKDRTANAWASWKENTPFQPDPRFRLRAEIELPAQDNRRNALQYILLHEIGHVLSIGSMLVPSWHTPVAALPPLDQYRFTRLSWALSPDGQQLQSRAEQRFPQRRQVLYYQQPRLPASAMAEVYGHVQDSSFVTLYAATNPFDDFAEAFASYVHVVLLHKPFAIRMYHGQHLQRRYTACWGQPRCAAKQAILAQLLQAN